MYKRIVSFLLIITISISMLCKVSYAKEEMYGSFDAFYIESNQRKTIDAMILDENVYVNAEFYEQFGFTVKLNKDVVIIGNTTDDKLPKGAVGFYYNETKCCRVNNVISEFYYAPFKTIVNDNGVWIPFNYSMCMLNGSVLAQENGTLLVSVPRQGVLDLLHEISLNSQTYSFDYIKDFCYGERTANFLDTTTHFVNLFNGLVTVDGASWVSFLNSNSILKDLFGDLGYDVKYGSNVSRLVCTNSSSELLDAVDDISTVNNLLSEDGALGEIFSELKVENDIKIGELYEQSQGILERINSGNSDMVEYNRIYSQIETALEKSSFLDIGDVVADVQKATNKVSTGLELLSLITETVGYYNEFNKRDFFAVESLEMFANDLPDMFGEVSFYTKVAMLKGANDFRKDAASYSMSRFITENIDDIISEGIDLCTKANIILLAWDLVSSFVPFISEGLNAADKYELSIYAMCIQNEAFKIYNDKLIELTNEKEYITAEDLNTLSKYAYAYLKMCYITRDAAIGGINTLTKEGKEASEILIEDQNNINLMIVPLLNLAKHSEKDEFNGIDFLYENSIEYSKKCNDKMLIKILKENDMFLDNKTDSDGNLNIIKDEAQAFQIAEALIKRYETYKAIGIACDLEPVDGEEGGLIWNSLTEDQKNYLSTPYKCLCCKTYDEAMKHTQSCIDSSILEQPLEIENHVISNDSLCFFTFNRGSLAYKNIRVDKFSDNKIMALAEEAISYDDGFIEMKMFTIECVDDYYKITKVSKYDISKYIKNYEVDSNIKKTLIDKYGIASEEQFVSCLGPDIQEYPSHINGIISIQCTDIDYDGNGEVFLLRVKKPNDNSEQAEIIAEVYDNDDGKLVLTATQSIYDVSYCISANIYLYHSKTLNQYCIIVDYSSAGGYTGVNYWIAKVYTVSNDSINIYSSLESNPMMGLDVNFENSLDAIDAPFAKYCTDLDNRNNASYYQPLCEIEHEIFGDSGTYLTRNHKLLINGNMV